MARALKILFILILLLVLAAIALVLTFDPNKYKPQIIELAAKNNVVLKMDGDLGWQLWPRIAIKAEQVAVSAPEAPDTPIAAIDRFAVAVQLIPLFSQEVKIDGITLTGAKTDLKVNKHGVGNWQSLGKVAAVEHAPVLVPAIARAHQLGSVRAVNARQPFNAAQQFQLARLTLQDSQLSFAKADGIHLSLTDLGADITDLKLDGSAIPVSLNTAFTLVRPEASTLKGETRANLTLRLPEALDQVIVEGLKAPVTLTHAGTSARADLSADAILLLGGEGVRYSGDLTLAPTNLQKLMIALGSPLPPMADARALHEVSLTSPFKGDSTQLMLEPLTIRVDSSTIKGKAGITDFETTALLVDIQGDAINLDHYLPPPEADTAGAAGAGGKKASRQSKPAASDALPLEALRALNLDLLAGFDKMTVKGLPFEQVKTKVIAKAGLIQLKSFDARLHEGPLNANGVFDARKDEATLSFNATGNKMPLEKLLQDFEVAPLVSGSGAVTVKGQSRGATSTALAEALTADIGLQSQQMLLHSMNLEKSLCELAMLAQRKEMPAIEWADFTKLQTLTSQIQLANQKLTVKSMNGGVESMAMGGLGVVDLAKGGLDFKFDLTIDEAANALLNCPIANKKLLNKKLPIRCKDSFAKLNARSCAPDMAAIEDMYRDEVKSKVNKELDKQLDKHLEKNPEAKELLKNLFGGKKKE